MKRFLLFVLFLLPAICLSLSVQGTQADEPVRVLIIDGQNNHDWRATTEALYATLKATGRFEIRVATSPQLPFPRVPHRARTPEDILAIRKVKALFKPELDKARAEKRSEWTIDFSDVDVVVLNYNGVTWPRKISDDYIRFVKDGGGTVLVHAANNAFRNWEEFNELIGMGWRKGDQGQAIKIDGKTGQSYVAKDAKFASANSGHGSQHPFQVTVRAKAHPIMRGLPPVWAHAKDELYHNMRGPVNNLTVLSSSYSDPKYRGTGQHEPMTWEVKYGKGRAIVTSMGHLWAGGMARGEYKSLYCLGFQTVFARACEYAATGEVTLPVPEGFPDAITPNPVPPHQVKWRTQKKEPSAARLSMLKKKKENPYCMLTPEEAMETFEIAPGYVVECFASEPMVEEPVLTVWDRDGAMYVAEMRSYMQDVNGESNKTMKNGRIKRLVDTDGDGKADKATVFVDNLFLPRMILPLSDGWIAVRVTGTMDVWLYRDSDGDGVADQKKHLYKRGPWGRNNPDKSVEHQDSGMLWNIDNNIYISYNMEQYRYTRGKWEPHPARSHWTQWGLTHDDSGDLYWVHNSLPLLQAYLHPKYWGIPSRNGVKQVPSSPIIMPKHYTPDFMKVKSLCLHNDRGGSASEVRGFTSACGQSIYRGDKFPPDAKGDYFVCDPTIHVVRRADVSKEGGMIKLSKSDLGTSVPDDYEFLRSSDINSRFVNTAEGPDGCLYVTDMYRGIIQDANWLNQGSRKNIVEMGLDKNKMHGRIWRIRHKDFRPRGKEAMPPMSQESTIALVRHLSSDSGWWRSAAQKEILLRKDRESIAEHLKALSRFSQNQYMRLHALWTLEGMDRMDLNVLKPLVRDRSALVRRAVIQLAEPRLHQSDYFEAIAVPMAGEHDGGVARQLVLSLGYNRKHPDAMDVIQQIAEKHAAVWGVQVATTLALWGEHDLPLIRKIKSGIQGGPFNQGVITQWTNLLANWDRVMTFPDSVSSTEQKRIQGGQRQFFENCISCHGADGKGVMAGSMAMAPNLYASKRVKGDPRQLLPIFINGLTGPIDGKHYAGGYMAPAKALGITRDDRLSELITYLRYVYGDKASSVSPEDVKRARKQYEKRETPWTDEQLKALKP